jgi:hypothetical protein
LEADAVELNGEIEMRTARNGPHTEVPEGPVQSRPLPD